MTFGEKLKELRLAMGFSLRDLGERVGLSHTYIHMLEGGDPPPRKHIVRRLEMALKAQGKLVGAAKREALARAEEKWLDDGA